MKWLLSVCTVVGLALFAPPSRAEAQPDTATLTVRIVDQTGAAVPQAAVRIENVDTQYQRQDETASDGHLTLLSLPPGVYTVLVERVGFAPARIDKLALSAGKEEEVHVKLKVESISEGVVVTAQKRGEERLRDVPIPISVVDTRALAQNGQTRLRDYFATIPGLMVRPFPGTGQFTGLTIRGIPPLGNLPTAGVVIDDVPFGSPIVFSAGHQPVPDLDPGDLARVEVLRGPQGTLFGASAMGGLLNFVTAEPSTEGFSGTIQTGANGIHGGEQAGYSFRGSVNVPVSKSFAFNASAFRRRDPGYIDNPIYAIDDVNEADVHGGRLSTLWHLSETVSLKFAALYEQADRNGLTDVVTQPGLGDLQQNYPPGVGFANSEVQAYSGRLNANFGKTTVTSITAYNAYSQHDSLDATTLPSNANLTERVFGTRLNEIRTDRRTQKFSQELRVSTPVGKSVDTLSGVFFTREESDLSQIDDGLDASGRHLGRLYDRRVPSTYDEYAAFFNVTYRATDRLDVQAGVRPSALRQSVAESYTGDDYVPIQFGQASPFIRQTNKASFSPITYLFTPRFKISSDVMVYARFASGFRTGSLNLVATPFYARGVPLTFDPDHTYDYEAGLKGEFFDNRVTIDASAYYTDWKDVQINVNLIDPQTNQLLVQYKDNAGVAKSEGVELSVQGRPLARTQLGGWIAFNNAVVAEDFPTNSPIYGKAGDRLPFGARLSGFISARQQFLLPVNAIAYVGAQASLVGNRVGQFQPFVSGVPVPRLVYPSYTQIDLRAGVDHASWSVNVYLNNVADERAPLGGGTASDGFPANAITYIAPRSVGITVTRRFGPHAR